MVRGVVGGPATCDGLSDLGRRQAEALRDRLARTGEVAADALIASTLPRARETAEIIAPGLGGLPVDSDEDFCEVHPGPEVDGLTWEEVVKRYGEPGDSWDPYATWTPGGESWVEFNHRIGRALKRVLDTHRDKTVVVACHGGVIDAALRQLLNIPIVGGFETWTHNTSLTEFERVRPDRWRLHRYNDVAHLEGLPSSSDT